MAYKDPIEGKKKQKELYYKDLEKTRECNRKKARELRALNKDSINARRRANYALNPQKARDSANNWHAKNKEKDNAKQKINREKLRNETFIAYGSKCQCCEESNFLFLTIDHIFNDGYIEQKEMGKRAGVHMYRKLKKLGYPKDRYQLLCFNCNMGRARNEDKVCPHITSKLEKKEE